MAYGDPLYEQKKNRFSVGLPQGADQFTADAGDMSGANYNQNFAAPQFNFTDSLTSAIGNRPSGPGFGMNLDTFNMAGSALGGLGKLASGWAALKGIGLAEDQLGFQQDSFNKNFAMQEAAYGNRVAEANARIDDMNNFKSVGKRAGGYVQQDRLTA